MRRFRTLLFVPVFAAALVACGGGGVGWGNSSSSSSTPPGGGGGGGGGGGPVVPPPGPADGTPPTTPTSLSATSVGDARIDLSWTASTDNVGVTGYRVERCEDQATACTNFIQIAVATVSPFSDTSSLAASTTYRYRMRATDGAGNVSAFSTIVVATTGAASGGTLPIGTLVHDGPATPEQISLFLPITGALPQTATATVRYRQTGSPTWITGHPLYRIQPTMTEAPNAGTVPNAFAWPIIDLTPGTTYEVEVTVNSGAVTNVQTLTWTTRALPPAAGAPNKTATPGTLQTVVNGLVAGDVLQLQNGTYTLAQNLIIDNIHGTDNTPIYIRGQSRTGVVLSNPGRVIHFLDASNVILENMTLQGSGVDSGVAATSNGVMFFDGSPTQKRITIRNITMTGVDSGIRANHEIQEFMAYDNTMTGNNTWTAIDPTTGVRLIDSNATWDDDAINISGFGNVAFNNTLKGFGDNFSFDPQQLISDSIGIHFYRNDVQMGGDDGTEVDGGHRNLSFYDNRLRNTMSFVSLDPLFGGPLVVARNISINIGRTPFKWNSPNSGQFIYNNTMLRTLSKPGVEGAFTSEAGWYQPNNGDQRSYGFRNNILIYRGVNTPLQTIRLDNSGHNPVDFTHNSWFPDAIFQWPENRYLSLAEARNNLPATTPVFSGSTKRHDQDNITVSNPFTVPVVLGPDYHTEVLTAYTPALAPGTTPKNSGVVIPNVTDGFTGGAPDRGAIIEGRPAVQYGDRS